MSCPSSRRWVANECLNVWQVAFFASPAFRTASRTARWTTDSCRWCRRRWPVEGSTYKRVAGNTHCHAHSRPAFGYFRPSAHGSSTQPAPAARSRWCSARARSTCLARSILTARGSIRGVGARAVEEQRHQAGRAIQLLEDRPDLLAGEDRGQVLRAFGTDEAVEPRKLDAEDLTVQKEQSVRRLVLR